MRHFEGEHAKIFLERGTAPSPDQTVHIFTGEIYYKVVLEQGDDHFG